MYKIMLLMLCLICLAIVISACENDFGVEVGTMQLAPSIVKIGEKATVEVNIKNPKRIPLTFDWSAERGEILRTSLGGIYTAPLEPGPDSIAIEVRNQGKLLVTKVFNIEVFKTTEASPGWAFLKAPFDLTVYYVPSGYVGDGEAPGFIEMQLTSSENPHTPPSCTKIVYSMSRVRGWGGVHYLYPANNWGDNPGYSIQGANKVTFWARGLEGGEAVEFKAGGTDDPAKQYKDSFAASTGTVKLTKSWNQFEIDLDGENLSRVICGFLWVASRDANQGKSQITFYLDDLKYE